MTETNMIASNPYDGERRPGNVGCPLPCVPVRTVAPDGDESPGAGWMIEVREPAVCADYRREAEKAAADVRPDGFFIASDPGPFGAYLRISGRGKDLIIVGGRDVDPREVELALSAVPGVGEVAVVGVPHPDLGEGVTAVVVPAAGAALDEERLLAAPTGRFVKSKQPRRVVFADAVPRNAMGKVRKNLLRARFADHNAAG